MIDLPAAWLQSLPVAPVLLPLTAAALIQLIGESRRTLCATLNVAATLAGFALAVTLALWVAREQSPAVFGVYLPGNWPVPFGIVLVADHLSALMTVLTGAVGSAALVYALPRWQHAGVHFHALYQLQLAGLYGAFLTGDLFNLFVFFEVLLAASYGLLLHGGGLARVRAGLHYIAINLAASLLFLIGVAVLYGVTGTLNMADIALKLPRVPTGDLGLLHVGATILALAFLTKAALWPLNFWLMPAYTAASAPAAAVFALLTKVGIYALLRLWTLCFPASAGASAHLGGEVLVWGGMATLAFGSLGMLASQRLGHVAAYAVVASSGTLLAALGFDEPALTGAALYYLASSTLAGCALFLLVELLERARDIDTVAEPIEDTLEPLPFYDPVARTGVNLDDDEQALVGRALPLGLAFLGITFSGCALIVSGMPPLSGFIGKLAMLSALVARGGVAAWTLAALLLGSGLCALTALARIGIRHFWSADSRPGPRLHPVECAPIALLLIGCALLVIAGEPVLRYLGHAAEALHAPASYVEAVLTTRPVSATHVEPVP